MQSQNNNQQKVNLLDKQQQIKVQQQQPLKQNIPVKIQQKRRLTSIKNNQNNPNKNTLNRIFNINFPIKQNDSLDTKCKYQIGNLYIGGVGVLNDQILKKNQINSVLTVLDRKQFNKLNINQKILDSFEITQHQWIDLVEDQDNILTYLDHSHDFIEDQLKSNSNLLVHCLDGLSRAAAIVVAYFMRKYKLKFQQAYDIVKKKRSDVQIKSILKEQIQKL